MEAIIKYSNCCSIVYKEDFSSSVIKFTIKSEEIAAKALPGQFIQIRTSEDYFPLWPRPFSIHDTNTQNGDIVIIFKVSGCGTSQLAKMSRGQKLHVFGPLGNGFPDLNKKRNALLVAGGVGLPPLFFLAKKAIQSGMISNKISMIAGGLSRAEFFAHKDLSELGIDLQVCTDDGSMGIKGTTVDLLEKNFVGIKGSDIFSCGPAAMLQKIDKLILKKNLPAFLSLEALMPCGYGICSGCAIKTYPSPDRGLTDDKKNYHLKRVCCDGPVFKAGEVIWE